MKERAPLLTRPVSISAAQAANRRFSVGLARALGGAILSVRTGYLVQINVLNQGDATAATLKIEGLLLQGTKQVEMSETTIDYVPAHSKRKGGLFFASDPRRVTLQLRAKGYEEP